VPVMENAIAATTRPIAMMIELMSCPGDTSAYAS